MGQYFKRTCHITAVVEDRPVVEAKPARKARTATARKPEAGKDGEPAARKSTHGGKKGPENDSEGERTGTNEAEYAMWGERDEWRWGGESGPGGRVGVAGVERDRRGRGRM